MYTPGQGIHWPGRGRTEGMWQRLSQYMEWSKGCTGEMTSEHLKIRTHTSNLCYMYIQSPRFRGIFLTHQYTLRIQQLMRKQLPETEQSNTVAPDNKKVM